MRPTLTGDIDGLAVRHRLLQKQFLGVAGLVAIRTIYLTLCYIVLQDLWYPGTNGYQIDFSLARDLAASFIYIISCIYISPLFYKVSLSFNELICSILFILYYIPLNCSYSLNDLPTAYFIFSNIFFLLLAVLLRKSNMNEGDSGTKSKVDVFADSRKIRAALFTVCCLMILYKISYNGLSINLSLDSSDVYSNRAAYDQYKSGIAGSPVAYLLSILINLGSYMAPVYLYISIRRKRLCETALSLFAVLSTFSLSSGKDNIYFLAIIFFVIMSNTLHWNIDNPFPFITVGFLLLLIVSAVAIFAWDSDWLYMAIIRRTMYLPIWIGSKYYDFFTSNTPLFFSDSVFMLQSILPSPYTQGVLDIISHGYFNGTVASPNTGLFAEAVMHLGYIGPLLYPLLIAALIRKTSRVIDGFERGLMLIIAAKLAIQLINVPILRTDFILSYFLFVLVIYMVDRRIIVMSLADAKVQYE